MSIIIWLHFCPLIFATDEDDLRNPVEHHVAGINPYWVILGRNHEDTPYMIDIDHDIASIVLAVRGLDLAK